MSFYPPHLRQVLHDSFLKLGGNACSDRAIELLMVTAAHESYLGRYLCQLNLPPQQGGACGIFQMDPRTHDDVQKRLIVGKGRFTWMPLDGPMRMIWDLRYAAQMARIHYMQFPEPIPPADEIAELAAYYKEFWNTPAGKADVPQVVRDYFKYVRGD